MTIPSNPLVWPGDLDEWLEAAAKVTWKFASTMREVPHSYIVKGKTYPEDDYLKAFGVIRTFGTPGKFYDRTNLYLHDEESGTRWWLMSRHAWKSGILNRSTDGKMYGTQNAPSTFNPYWAEYDHVGAYYDDIYLPVSSSERVALWKTVDRLMGSRKPRTLDLGCGTGGTLDSRIAGASDITAVDPSQAMLNDLVMKYPNISQVVSASAEEYLAWETGQVFDLVIASFGSASYLSPEVIGLLPNMSRRAVVLAFYAPGYRPDYHRLMPGHDVLDDSEALAVALDLSRGASEMQGNFLVVSFPGEADR